MTDDKTTEAMRILHEAGLLKARDIVAAELLDADATQAATSRMVPGNVPAGAVRVDYLPDGRFRLVRSGAVWSVEEEIEPGVFKQHGGHYQSESAADAYIQKELVRREFGLPSETGSADESGLTVWLHLNGSVTGKLRAGLVANPDGRVSVAVDGQAGLGEAAASDLAELVNHLNGVARLSMSLQVSPPRGGSRGVDIDGQRNRGRYQDSGLVVDGDQRRAFTGERGFDSGDHGSVDPELSTRVIDHKLAHDASPSVVDLGGSTVGDEGSAGDQPRSPADPKPAVHIEEALAFDLDELVEKITREVRHVVLSEGGGWDGSETFRHIPRCDKGLPDMSALRARVNASQLAVYRAKANLYAAKAGELEALMKLGDAESNAAVIL